MPTKRLLRLLFAVSGVALLLYVLLHSSVLFSQQDTPQEISRRELRQQIENLQSQAALLMQREKELLIQLDQLKHPLEKQPTVPPLNAAVGAQAPPHLDGDLDSQKVPGINPTPAKTPAKTPVLPVLVFACNRPTVTITLDDLLQYRQSAERFPIIVSQDCADQATSDAIDHYQGKILTHLKQPDQNPIVLPPGEKQYLDGYYKISRHYKWALTQVFDVMNYAAVIIVEDDLRISPDFFDYFESTYSLLQSDSSLYCVSAWNDNGKTDLIEDNPALLYRTDFFPGLGWMLLRSAWDGIKVNWPASYWDDWLRQDAQRQDRACIRPEISRTSTFGKIGVSKGLFFDKHLKFIVLNTKPAPFKSLDLSFLRKDIYDEEFVKTVYGFEAVPMSQLTTIAESKSKAAVRVQYSSKDSFKQIAQTLNFMDDFKEGVPRTAYRGVVPIMYKGLRIYVAPPPDWNKYDLTWT